MYGVNTYCPLSPYDDGLGFWIFDLTRVSEWVKGLGLIIAI